MQTLHMSNLLTITEEPRTHPRNKFPLMFTKFRSEVPLAGTPQEEQSGPLKNKALAPVSYTHLTLPTKLEV